MEDKSSYFMLAVVGIVAIVGIIVMVMGSGRSASAPVSLSSGEDMSGQATWAGCYNYCNNLCGEGSSGNGESYADSVKCLNRCIPMCQRY